MMGKKIISFSVWGDTPMYTIGAVRNAELASEIYPDWICRFYLGDDVPKDIVDKLESFDNTEIQIMSHKENDWQGMFWRFYAINLDEDIDMVIFRDTDSRLSLREYEAVREWIQSEKPLHIMRDHPYHSEPIMGGMWGCKVKEILEEINQKVYDEWKFPRTTNMEEVIGHWLKSQREKTRQKLYDAMTEENFVTKGIDQRFLRAIVYDLLHNDAWIQDSYPQYNCWSGRFDYQQHGKFKERNTGFPAHRGNDWNNFVGQVYDENDVPNQEYASLIFQRDQCMYQDWAKDDNEFIDAKKVDTDLALIKGTVPPKW
jgi:hypothetical protein